MDYISKKNFEEEIATKLPPEVKQQLDSISSKVREITADCEKFGLRGIVFSYATPGDDPDDNCIALLAGGSQSFIQSVGAELIKQSL